MSGKSSTRQQHRQALQGEQAQGKAARPAGNEQRPGQPQTTNAAQGKAAAAERKAKAATARQAQRRAARRRKIGVRTAIGAATAWLIAGLFVIFGSASHSGASAYPYQVGSPGPGTTAPGFTLTASTGRPISLSQYRGKNVLLFFQEGLTCQPCWNQIADLQHHAAQLRAAGISNVVSITTDPASAIAQKARDMGLTIPVLSDPNLAVSQAYHANDYGMMGSSTDGHTFILIGPDGKIRWRADYGGAPKYVMYLPTSSLLADIQAGEHPA
jgi:peroxiredoxin Q/BCP